MSAIDFDMEIERLPNPKSDRVKITMSGKFLPYKYYGSEQGHPGVRREGDVTLRLRSSQARRVQVSATGPQPFRSPDLLDSQLG